MSDKSIKISKIKKSIDMIKNKLNIIECEPFDKLECRLIIEEKFCSKSLLLKCIDDIIKKTCWKLEKVRHIIIKFKELMCILNKLKCSLVINVVADNISELERLCEINKKLKTKYMFIYENIKKEIELVSESMNNKQSIIIKKMNSICNDIMFDLKDFSINNELIKNSFLDAEINLYDKDIVTIDQDLQKIIPNESIKFIVCKIENDHYTFINIYNYFNNINNKDQANQLINQDQNFTNMLNVIVNNDNKRLIDVLATYGYDDGNNIDYDQTPKMYINAYLYLIKSVLMFFKRIQIPEAIYSINQYAVIIKDVFDKIKYCKMKLECMRNNRIKKIKKVKKEYKYELLELKKKLSDKLDSLIKKQEKFNKKQHCFDSYIEDKYYNKYIIIQ